MRKTLLLLALILTTTYGCITTTATSVAKENWVNMRSLGVLHIAALVENHTNFSSLLFDKTKAKPVNTHEFAYAKLGKDAIFHVLPVKINTPYRTYYDTGTQAVLRNYITLNKFGNITQNSHENDFFVMANITESLEMRDGENSSTIEVTIVDRENLPYFHTQVRMISRSDKNFWYYPSKDSRPVSYLTMKGMDYLLGSSLIKAFQES